MMDVDQLADQIKAALGNPVDKDGNTVATTDEMKAYARAVINTMLAGKAANAPGTINGMGSPGGALDGGSGSGGLISGLSPGTWLGILTAAFPTANSGQLSTEAQASTAYLMASSLVGFAPGKITGKCMATAESPGPLADGAGSGGLISGLDGTAWSSAVAGGIGGGGPLIGEVYSTVAKHIMDNAECAYATGGVVGNFASGGGALIGGAGANGTIT